MRLHQHINDRASKTNVNVRRRRIGLQPETRQGYILLCMALWSVISFLLISNFVISTVTVTGTSMLPTLHPGQVYLLNRWSHRIHHPSYGELVVIRDRVHKELLVKRVVAIPGDTIQVRQGHLILNGRTVHEPYLPSGTHTPAGQMGRASRLLANNEFFVMGDNRLLSEDSRLHGPIRRSDIIGTISLHP